MAVAGPLVELQGLTTSYGRQRGFGPLDLRLGPGIHGLLGPNGSGKTTLIKTLLGFLEPSAGSGRVLGLDIVRERIQVRRRIGYMAENDVLVPGLTPTQTVRLAAELCGMPSARAHEAASEALQAVGMGDERFHAPQRLSTGQRQRMKLAAALVHAPRLLFLDEPTNGLDARGRRAMLDLVREVAQERDISVLLSTHILPDVEAVCDDAIIMREGLLAGTEAVGARAVRRTQGLTWHRVEVLGDPGAFAEACRHAGLRVEADALGLRVAAPDAEAVIAVAGRNDILLSGLVAETDGVQEAILERMESPGGNA